MKKSKLGRAIRATAQNARAAKILGVDTEKVYAATFGLNAALCGVAGALRDQCRYRPAWKNIYSTFKKRGEKFGLYSLRHGYSVRGTSRNIDSGSMSDSMGNKERTFLDSYQSSSKKTRRAAFAQAAKLLEDKQ